MHFRCRMEWFKPIEETEWSQILSEFLNMSDKNSQDIHLQGLIVANDIKQRKARKSDCEIGPFKKEHSFQYFVIFGGRRVSICKSAFLSLHAVSQKRVFRMCQLLVQGKIPSDMRGTNPCPSKIPENIINLIDEHIRAFPLKETHYAGKVMQYLDARLDVKTMHEMFLGKYPETNVKYDFYRKYFQDNFGFSFGRPQIDVCGKCEELEAKIKSSYI